MVQVPKAVGLHRVDEAGEEVVALALVFDERVLLAHRPQADAGAEVVHLGEVLPPLVVDDRHDDVALELAEDVRADLLLTLLVHHRRLLLEGDGHVAIGGIVGVFDGVPTEPGVVDHRHPGDEVVPIPLGWIDAVGHVEHQLFDDLVPPSGEELAGVVAQEHPVAPLVDDLPLGVHHLVVLEDVLADLEVLRLDLVLRPLDRLRDHVVLDGHVAWDLQPSHDRLHPVAGEAPHQVVLEREVEPGLAGVALPSGAAAQLVVDAARLVTLGAEHVEAAQFEDLVPFDARLVRVAIDRGGVLAVVLGSLQEDFALAHLLFGELLGVAAQHDVDAATGHVGGDGDGAELAGLGDDLGLPLVVLGVEHLVGDAPALELDGEPLRLLDRDRADEHRLAVLVTLDDVVDEGIELGVLVDVDEVGLVCPDHRHVRGDDDDVEVVDLVELGRLGVRGAGHARQLLVHAEVVLEGDRRQRLVLLLDLDALFGLDGLMEALGVAPALEDAAGELVDDLHLAVAQQVLDVALVELLGLQRDVEVVDEVDVGEVVHVLDAEDLLDPLHALLGGDDLPLLLVDLVVGVAAQPLRDAGEVAVPLPRLADPAADDERGAGLVDEDRVDLVDDRVGVAALDHVLEPHRHVVAQVVEAELVVGPVGDVSGVRGTPLRRCHLGLDEPDLEPEKAVDAAHPLRITAGEVIVDRHDVDAAPGDAVEVRRHRRNQRLPLAGLHLGDVAPVQRPGADDLDVVVALAEGALRRFAHHGERLRLEVVEGGSVGKTLAELGGLGAKLVVAEPFDLRFEGVDLYDELLELLQLLALADLEDLAED